MLKVHTVKNTVFKDRFSEIAFGQLYIDHLHIDKFCSHQPGRAEFRAYKNGLVEACTGKVIGIQDAVGKVCPVKTGFPRVAAVNRAVGQIRARKVRAAQCTPIERSLMCSYSSEVTLDRKSTRLNSSHECTSRIQSSA